MGLKHRDHGPERGKKTRRIWQKAKNKLKSTLAGAAIITALSGAAACELGSSEAPDARTRDATPMLFPSPAPSRVDELDTIGIWPHEIEPEDPGNDVGSVGYDLELLQRVRCRFCRSGVSPRNEDIHR